jgi:hypothetical protein
LITDLQGQATVVLCGFLKDVTKEEVLEALEACFGNQHLATTYHNQLKMRIHGVGKSLQEFSTAIEQLAHHAYPTLPEDHIRKEAG